MFSATFPTFPTFPTPNWCLHQSFTLYQQITCVLQFTKANQSTKMFIFVLCTLWVLPHPTCSGGTDAGDRGDIIVASHQILGKQWADFPRAGL